MKRKNESPGLMIKKKLKKDPDAPKRPASAYIKYMIETRESIKEEIVNKEGGESPRRLNKMVMCEVSRRWNVLPDAEKAVYEKKLLEEKAVYKIEKANYDRKVEESNKLIFARVDKMKGYFDFVADNWMRVALKHPRKSPYDMQTVLWNEWNEQYQSEVSDSDNENCIKKNNDSNTTEANKSQSSRNKAKKEMKSQRTSEYTALKDNENNTEYKFSPQESKKFSYNNASNQELKEREKDKIAFKEFSEQLKVKLNSKEEILALEPSVRENFVLTKIQEKWESVSKEQREELYSLAQTHGLD